MRRLVVLLALLFSPFLYAADIPEKYRGNWLLVNGTLVLSISADGTMSVPGTDQKGSFTIAADDTFRWQIKDVTQSGNFSGERLYLRNDVKDAPRWLQVLEFRRGTPEETQGILLVAAEQRKQSLNVFEKVRRTSIEKSMLNDARQLAAASQQHVLMENIPAHSSIILQIDPATGAVSGPLSVFVAKISPGTKAVDNQYEASESATFSLQNPDAYGGLEVVFDADGKLKK